MTEPGTQMPLVPEAQFLDQGCAHRPLSCRPSPPGLKAPGEPVDSQEPAGRGSEGGRAGATLHKGDIGSPCARVMAVCPCDGRVPV